MKRFLSLTCCTMALFLGISTLFGQSAKDFNPMVEKLITQSVPLMRVDSLASCLQDFQILDARELEEYEVSHIPGAIWVGYDDFNIDNLPQLDKPLVVYCSVGYRSEKIGEQILKQFPEQPVFNLFGGIFDWVNQGQQVEHKTGPTQKVHGYNKSWGKWVRKGKVVY